MNKQLYIDDKDLISYFLNLLGFIQNYPQIYRDVTNHCLSPNCFASNNLLTLIEDNQFVNKINFILGECEKHIPDKVDYFYIHMIDYKNGGDMLIHKHDHNEDYSFILYLNDCNDGYTTLYVDRPIRVKPETGKILFFSSDVYHSATSSTSKKVLVGGLKIK